MVQENCVKKKIIIITGPTATGKSKLAVELAKKLNTEIISCDSMQVYKYMDIGTAKVTKEEMDGIPHHLIDVVEPSEDFNVSNFVLLAEKEIDRLHKENKIPIIVGGTGLYINSLIFGYNLGNSYKNEELRQELTEKAKEFGNEYVHNILKELDEEASKNIHPNNLKRVIRAIEICKMDKKKSTLTNAEPKYNAFCFALNLPREELYEKINLRVDIMVQNGLIKEVEDLIEKGYTLDNNSMQGIGYKQIIESKNGEYDIDFAIDKIKQLSRNYAKRQITWFKKIPNIVWLNAKENNINNILKVIENE